MMGAAEVIVTGMSAVCDDQVKKMCSLTDEKVQINSYFRQLLQLKIH